MGTGGACYTSSCACQIESTRRKMDEWTGVVQPRTTFLYDHLIITDRLLHLLIQKGHLSPDQIEEIKEKKTRGEKIDLLIWRGEAPFEGSPPPGPRDFCSRRMLRTLHVRIYLAETRPSLQPKQISLLLVFGGFSPTHDRGKTILEVYSER